MKVRFRGETWRKWGKGLRSRDPRELVRANEKMAAEVEYHKFLQYVFFRQWADLRQYCLDRGVKLIGDIPFYVSLESADVWANQDLFRLNPNGSPAVVAGVPPDYFSKTGQFWGNPIYRWDVLKNRGFDWWVNRIRSMFEKFDALRLDHFIGFQRYWEVSNRVRAAKSGYWVQGPGEDFFRHILRRLGPIEIIAEDLGQVTREVTDLREKLGFSGMRVLQFEFGPGSDAADGRTPIFPRNCILYTGTHDNDTIMGWINEGGSRSSIRSRRRIREEREAAIRCTGSDGREFHWDMIRFAFSSDADVAIIPMQDILGLGSRARMNRPATRRRNWVWRLCDGELRKASSERLLQLTEKYGRLAKGR